MAFTAGTCAWLESGAPAHQGVPGLQSEPGWVASVEDEANDISARTTRLPRRTVRVSESRQLYLSAHPFLLWWTLTYGLSMLAWYEPKGWAERTSVNRNPLSTLAE
jgi:hypothetical protein